jgi:hypothetical protein
MLTLISARDTPRMNTDRLNKCGFAPEGSWHGLCHAFEYVAMGDLSISTG